MAKKERIRITINENGDPSVDILNASGKSCEKDAAEWANIFGGKANVTKKPEYYKPEQKVQNTQIQKG